MPTLSRASNLVRSTQAQLSPDELLRLPTATLLGVSSAAAAALGSTFGLASVFDLAASRHFDAARLAVAAPTQALPGDLFDAAAAGNTARAQLPLSVLRAVGANAAAVQAALGVLTLGELAAWPPYLAARHILNEAFFPTLDPAFDPEAPDDLVPGNGRYPTERVFYRKLLIDSVGQPAAGAQPVAIENSPAIDIASAIVADTVFQRVATGALLTFSQSWFGQGLALGQLLHSMALAPGESTRMAMIDWSRQSSASGTESTDETDVLANTNVHNRALSEVTQATATEFQTGSSQTTSDSRSSQSGSSTGLEIGPLAFGGSSSGGRTHTEAMTTSSTSGARDMAAQFAQNINDRSQQNASSARSRRASVVREVSQSEHEGLSTRVVTNYNHMHALTVQYYEVVQAFRATTQLERAERCIFVPMKLLDFSDAALVERYRAALIEVALDAGVARQLAQFGQVIVSSLQPSPRFNVLSTAVLQASVTKVGSALSATGDAGDAAAPTPAPTPAPAPSPDPAPVAFAFDLRQLVKLQAFGVRAFTSRQRVALGLPADALITGIELRAGQALAFEFRRNDGSLVALAETTPTSAQLAAPESVLEMASIRVRQTAIVPLQTRIALRFSVLGTIGVVDVPVAFAAGGPFGPMQEALTFDGGSAMKELTAHLQANRLHYSQAVFRALDDATLSTLLSRFSFSGVPLAQWVDHRPVAVTANYLVFKANLPNSGAPTDPALQAATTQWQSFLQRAGLAAPAPRSEIIALPSGGVFAEAVLGRANSAERLNLERFFNWQDSPLPFVASEIAALQAGSRAEDASTASTPLGNSLLSQQAPTALPDPAGVAAIAAALQSANLFRDMSGLAQSAALAQAALKVTESGAQAAGQQASDTLKTVMTQNTERMRIAAKVAAAMAGVPPVGGGGKPGDLDNASVTERGGALAKAKQQDGASGTPGAGGAGSGLAGETFKQQTGITGQQAARKVLEAGIAGSNASEPASTPAAPGGALQAAPKTLRFSFQPSAFLSDPARFDNAPVPLDVRLSERDGTRIFNQQGPAGSTRFVSNLRTADTRLFFEVFYTYETAWPQPTKVVTNAFANVDLQPGDTQVNVNGVVLMSTREVPIDSATAPSDTAVQQALQAAGIDIRKVLKKPVVTPRTGGGFTASFPLFDKVVPNVQRGA